VTLGWEKVDGFARLKKTTLRGIYDHHRKISKGEAKEGWWGGERAHDRPFAHPSCSPFPLNK